MENWFSKSLLIIVAAGMFFQSCNNKQVGSGNQTSMVDTLGGTYERIIHDYYGDTVVKTIRYMEDETNYFEVVLHQTGQKYMEGWVRNGERDGEWYSWYPNGVIWSYGTYDNGKRTGESEAYYENGSIRIRQKYSEGVPDGTWVFFYPDGKRQLEVVYEMGEKLSETRY